MVRVRHRVARQRQQHIFDRVLADVADLNPLDRYVILVARADHPGRVALRSPNQVSSNDHETVSSEALGRHGVPYKGLVCVDVEEPHVAGQRFHRRDEVVIVPGQPAQQLALDHALVPAERERRVVHIQTYIS